MIEKGSEGQSKNLDARFEMRDARCGLKAVKGSEGQSKNLDARCEMRVESREWQWKKSLKEIPPTQSRQ